MNRQQAKVLGREVISTNMFRIDVEKIFDFIPGQTCAVGLVGDETRDYSIYSTIQENKLSFLVKIIPDGKVSNQLSNIKFGEPLDIIGPFGSFYPMEADWDKYIVFIATGVGVSPFRSIIVTSKTINKIWCKGYILVHGLKLEREYNYFSEDIFGNISDIVYPQILSGNQKKVTDQIPFIVKGIMELGLEGVYFLCGNSKMVEKSYQILRHNDINRVNIRTEIFF